jgi:hypothetical protein
VIFLRKKKKSQLICFQTWHQAAPYLHKFQSGGRTQNAATEADCQISKVETKVGEEKGAAEVLGVGRGARGLLGRGVKYIGLRRQEGCLSRMSQLSLTQRQPHIPVKRFCILSKGSRELVTNLKRECVIIRCEFEEEFVRNHEKNSLGGSRSSRMASKNSQETTPETQARNTS